MKKKNKRGFTIVELVVVVAIIAILAAVLIPTFTSIVKKANVSNDTSLVKYINDTLAVEEITDGKATTVHDAIAMAEKGGFDVEKLTPKSDGEIWWNSKTNRFLLVDESGNVIFGDKTDAEDSDIWKITDDEEKAHTEDNYYLIGSVATLEYNERTIYYRNVTGNWIQNKPAKYVSGAVADGKKALGESTTTEAVVTIIKDCSISGSIYATYVTKVVVNEGVTFTMTGSIILNSNVDKCVFENKGTTIASSIWCYGTVKDTRLCNEGTLKVGRFFDSLGVTNGNINNGTILITSTNTTYVSYTGANFVNNGTIKSETDGVNLSVGANMTGTGTVYSTGAYAWSNTEDKFVGVKGLVYNVTTGAGYLTFAEAISAAKDNDVLQVQEDINSFYTTIDKKLTIDLNGHTLSYSNSGISTSGQINITENGDLTIIDSTAKTLEFGDGGTYTYSSGRIKCSAIANRYPTIMVKDGGKLNVESGIIEAGSENYAICIANDADPSNKKGATSSVVTISGGLVINSSDKAGGHAIGIYGTSYGSATTNGSYSDTDPKLIINGGVVWANTGCAIIGQGSLNNTNIEITGGMIYSRDSEAIYHPQYGQLTISGGTIKGVSAICLKGGKVTITGGTLEATEKTAYVAPTSAKDSGTWITGDALYIEDNYGRNITVTITTGENGATFKTTAEDTVACRVLFSVEGKAATVTVNGTEVEPETNGEVKGQ